MSHGTPGEMTRAKTILASCGASRTDIHENHCAAIAAEPVA
jgi:hypothetical protein